MREATAHHEAGHAVVSWIRGLGIQEVTIRSEEGVYGQCTGEFPDWFGPDMGWEEEHQVHAEDQIESILAGVEAERIYREQHPEIDWTLSLEDGSGHDRQIAWTLAELACGSWEESQAFLAWLRVRARNRVTQHWPFVVALAAELMEKEALSGDEALTFLNVERFGPERTAALTRATKELAHLASQMEVVSDDPDDPYGLSGA